MLPFERLLIREKLCGSAGSSPTQWDGREILFFACPVKSAVGGYFTGVFSLFRVFVILFLIFFLLLLSSVVCHLTSGSLNDLLCCQTNSDVSVVYPPQSSLLGALHLILCWRSGASRLISLPSSLLLHFAFDIRKISFSCFPFFVFS